MPKRRPIGPPKWQKRKESKSKTNVLSVPMAAAKGITAVDTDKNVVFKIGLEGTVGQVAAAVAVPEAANEDVMTTVGLMSVAMMIAVMYLGAKLASKNRKAKLEVKVEPAGRAAPQARPEIATSTPWDL